MRFGEDLIHEEIYRALVRESGQASCFSFLVMAAVLAGGIVGGAIASVSPGVADPGAIVVITMAVAGTLAYAFKLARSRPALSTDDIRRLLPLLHLDDGEQAYMDALLALGENPALDGETVAQVARELRSLLDTYYELKDQLDVMHEAMGTATEEEHENLRKRLEQAEDAEARTTLQESLRLLEHRLQNRHALAAHALRMEAHLEFILQTLKSQRETLARLKMASERLSEYDVEQLHQSLLELRQRAAAIENAAQEVLGAIVPGRQKGLD